MALRASINHRDPKHDHINEDDPNHHQHEDDEEIEETEDDLIENYRFLTQHCGVLRQSPTTSILSTIQKQQKQTNQSLLTRQYSSITEDRNNNQTTKELQRSLSASKPPRCSPINDLNNNNQSYSTAISRIPPTIYYNDTADDGPGSNHPFSLVNLFARMKARLKHDKRYRPKQTHQLLHEEDPQEWHELTKNVRTILTKALLPDGGYDALAQRTKTSNSRQSSYKKGREHDPVLPKEQDDEEKINIDIDDELNTEGDPHYDEVIWQKFLTCARGFNYRRGGVCKAVDRQQFQGQLVFFYGIANNILIDENLKASGLG